MSDPLASSPALPTGVAGAVSQPPVAQPAAPGRHPTGLAVVAAVLAVAAFIGMDALAKLLSARYDAWQLTFLRFASGCLFAVPLWLWFRSPLPGRRDWPLHLLRCALLLVALVSWFHALSLLPLVQAVAVGYTAPLFISLLAMLVLRERPSRWIWLALALGAAGVGVSLWPELQASTSTAAAGQRIEGLASAGLSALSYSGVVVLARHQAQRDALWSILLVQNLLPALVLLLPMTGMAGVTQGWWVPLAPADAGPVLLMGALATLGLTGVTWAYARLEASRAAPLEYAGFLAAAALGYALFDEVPTASMLVSAALIVGGCLLLLRR